VTLPEHDGVSEYRLLWDSSSDGASSTVHAPGEELLLGPTSMRLFRAV